MFQSFDRIVPVSSGIAVITACAVDIDICEFSDGKCPVSCIHSLQAGIDKFLFGLMRESTAGNHDFLCIRCRRLVF